MKEEKIYRSDRSFHHLKNRKTEPFDMKRNRKRRDEGRKGRGRDRGRENEEG